MNSGPSSMDGVSMEEETVLPTTISPLAARTASRRQHGDAVVQSAPAMTPFDLLQYRQFQDAQYRAIHPGTTTRNNSNGVKLTPSFVGEVALAVKPQSTPSSGEAIAFDLAKSLTLMPVDHLGEDVLGAQDEHAADEATREPTGPTTTAYFAVKPMHPSLSKHLERPVDVHIPHGSAACLYNMCMPRNKDGATWAEECSTVACWSHHPDELAAPTNLQYTDTTPPPHDSASRRHPLQSPWQEIANSSAARMAYVMHGNESSHVDRCEANSLNRAAACDNGDACLSRYNAVNDQNTHESSPETTFDDVYAYSAWLRSVVTPEWGTCSPVDVLSARQTGIAAIRVNPNEWTHEEATSSSSQNGHNQYPPPPEFLSCRMTHVYCAVCLLADWMREAANSTTVGGVATYYGRRAPHEQILPWAKMQLKCPRYGCNAFFSMRAFWPYIYSTRARRMFQEALVINVPTQDYSTSAYASPSIMNAPALNWLAPQTLWPNNSNKPKGDDDAGLPRPPVSADDAAPWNQRVLAEMEWFWDIWFPTVYLSKRHWHMARKAPATFLLLDSGGLDYIWRLVVADAADSGSSTSVERSLPFCVAREASLGDGGNVESWIARFNLSHRPAFLLPEHHDAEQEAFLLQHVTSLVDEIQQGLAVIALSGTTDATPSFNTNDQVGFTVTWPNSGDASSQWQCFHQNSRPISPALVSQTPRANVRLRATNTFSAKPTAPPVPHHPVPSWRAPLQAQCEAFVDSVMSWQQEESTAASANTHSSNMARGRLLHLLYLRTVYGTPCCFCGVTCTLDTSQCDAPQSRKPIIVECKNCLQRWCRSCRQPSAFLSNSIRGAMFTCACVGGDNAGSLVSQDGYELDRLNHMADMLSLI